MAIWRTSSRCARTTRSFAGRVSRRRTARTKRARSSPMSSRCAEGGQFFGFAITDSAGEAVLGSIGVRIVAAGIGDIGYFVRVGARRRGIGRALDSSSEPLGFRGAWACATADHHPSRRTFPRAGWRSRADITSRACCARGWRSTRIEHVRMRRSTRSFRASSISTHGVRSSFPCQSGSSSRSRRSLFGNDGWVSNIRASRSPSANGLTG